MHRIISKAVVPIHKRAATHCSASGVHISVFCFVDHCLRKVVQLFTSLPFVGSIDASVTAAFQEFRPVTLLQVCQKVTICVTTPTRRRPLRESTSSERALHVLAVKYTAAHPITHHNTTHKRVAPSPPFSWVGRPLSRLKCSYGLE